MTQVSELINNYKEIRSRLRQPPNQVKDRGINLYGYRIPSDKPAPKPIPKVEEYRSPIHCKVSIQIIPKPPIEPVVPRKLKMVAIERAVCKVFSIGRKALWGRCKENWLVRPRHVAWYVACTHTDLSMSKIAHWCGRDHTSVLHAKRVITEMLLVDEELADAVKLVEFLAFGGYYDKNAHAKPTFLNHVDLRGSPMATEPQLDLAQGPESSVPESSIHQMDQ